MFTNRPSVDPVIDYRRLTFGPEIGRGGYAIVYKGTYVTASVAIKELQRVTPAIDEEFKREATRMAKLHHPNIVNFYGYCTMPKKCLVMEYMPRGDLAHVLSDPRIDLPWGLRLEIAHQMAAGLYYLHQEGDLHRDIKSLNVLLDENYNAKLADFGISRNVGTIEVADSIVGTVTHMAPEYLCGELFTKKSDIYSLGITFWELATRRSPYQDQRWPHPVKDQRPFIEEIVIGNRETLPSAAECPRPFAQLIMQCWSDDQNSRPDAGSVVARISQMQQSQTLPTARPQTPASPGISEASSSGSQGSATSRPSLAPMVMAPLMVLNDLSDFFIEGRYEGELSPNLKRYNEILRPHQAMLRYDQSQKKHLFVQNKQILDTDSAIEAIEEMLASLSVDSSSSQAATTAPRPTFFPPAPQAPVVDLRQLPALLQHVVYGEQDQAEALIRANPGLLSGYGDVTDYSGRTFKDVSALQCVLWALDTHYMCDMIIECACAAGPGMVEELLRQYDEFEKNEGVEYTLNGQTKREKHFDFTPLKTALDVYVKNYDPWTADQCKAHWCKEVGGAQKLLPAHVVHHYCDPDESFDPTPSFKKDALKRSLAFEKYDESKGAWVSGVHWYPLLAHNSSGFAVWRAARRRPAGQAVDDTYGWVVIPGASRRGRGWQGGFGWIYRPLAAYVK